MAAIVNRIAIGDDVVHPILTFENPEIKKVSSETAASIVGEELFIDQFNADVEYELILPYVFKPTDYNYFRSRDGYVLCTNMNYDLRALPYGTKITFFSDNRIVAEFYCKTVERVGKWDFKINAVSPIGIMDKQYHVGGIYTGQLFEDVLAEIIDDKYRYQVDTNVAKQTVFGWLPYDTKRKNLYQLLLAYGVTIVANETGQMYFKYLEDISPTPIPDERVFSGGSVVYNEPASRVEVTEHSFQYLPNVDEETLFDNTSDDEVIYSLITFDKPIWPDSVRCSEGEGFTIYEIGVNYMIASGRGILVGKPYTHMTKIIYKEDDTVQIEKVVKVEDATLVSLMNSENVLLRLSQYYFNATTVKQDIEQLDEKVGGRYTMKNAFGEYVSGFISRMSTNVSSFRRTNCDIIQSYIPVGQGSNYSNYEIISLQNASAQDWTIPASVKNKELPLIRVVLIGSGYDGENGHDGESGERLQPEVGVEYVVAKGGAGGLGGLGGLGGKVLSVTLDVTSLKKLTFKRTDRASILTSGSYYYSSEQGSSYNSGFYEPFTDTIYALPGEDGVDGVAGGDGEIYQHSSGLDSENQATNGEDIVFNGITYKGGVRSERYSVNGKVLWPNSRDSGNLTLFFAGSGGGGAAAGRNGGDAQLLVGNRDYFNMVISGAGANAINPNPTPGLYGAGGNGGHGGGGSGGAAFTESWNHEYSTTIDVRDQAVGDPGQGSPGSLGHFGCAIIYY